MIFIFLGLMTSDQNAGIAVKMTEEEHGRDLSNWRDIYVEQKQEEGKGGMRRLYYLI